MQISKKLLLLASILASLVTPYSFGSGTGPSGNTSAPSYANVSQIDFYHGVNNDIGAIQVYYGNPPTASNKVPYTSGACLAAGGAKTTLTLTPAQWVTKIVVKYRIDSSNQYRLVKLEFSLDGPVGSTESRIIQIGDGADDGSED